MKAYTDLEQSKKLAEILSLESADMCFANDGTAIKIDANSYNVRKLMWKDYVVEVIPCWSLAALLEIIPEPILTYIDENNWNISIFKDNHFKDEVISNNPLNACYEMIIKLHEQNLL